MNAAGYARFGATLLVWCALLGWHVTADRLDCTAAALSLALVTALLTLSGTETAFYRRRAFVRLYLRSGGLLFRLLSRKALMLFWQAAKSLLLGLFLLIATLTLDTAQWLLLLADLLVLALVLTALSTMLEGELQEDYREPVVRHWAMRLNAVLLWLAAALLLYISPQENYSDLRWEEVVAFSAAQPTVGCDALALLARLGAVGEALALWSAQHLLGSLREPTQVLMAWAAFLAAFGASFLLAWAYSRALVGVLARPWAVWRSGEE
ncbi:MAG: hypothetical protein U9Q81_09865 [Pseudomonadota bacterium]|nr:hypothetical protein [Pseudomonadota bacterium]